MFKDSLVIMKEPCLTETIVNSLSLLKQSSKPTTVRHTGTNYMRGEDSLLASNTQSLNTWRCSVHVCAAIIKESTIRNVYIETSNGFGWGKKRF